MYFFAIFMFVFFMVFFLGYARSILLRPNKEDKNNNKVG